MRSARLVIGLVAALGAAVIGNPASAAPSYALDRMTPTEAGARIGGPELNAVRGYTFRAEADGIRVTQLGAVTPLDQRLTLSLFDVATGSLLAQSMLDYTAAATSAWQFVDLDAPVMLEQGATYFVGAFASSFFYYSSIMTDQDLLPSGDISFVEMNYCNFCSPDILPTGALGQSMQGFVDIGYERIAVPTPAGLGLLGLGLLGVASVRRRTR